MISESPYESFRWSGGVGPLAEVGPLCALDVLYVELTWARHRNGGCTTSQGNPGSGAWYLFLKRVQIESLKIWMLITILYNIDP